MRVLALSVVWIAVAGITPALPQAPTTWNVDRACGIVWRYVNENNYDLARANALDDNVCWYYGQNGRRIEVYFNGQKLIDVHDSRCTAPGRVGVWTKADSYTLFDDLTATPLAP